MRALVSFVQAYALWIYLLLVLGIILGIKLFLDARRLSHTTLFSLDQERATEQSFRAIVLIGVMIAAIIAVTSVNVVLAPAAPQTESAILRGPTATLSAMVFPTQTPVPTFTPTLIPPTETPFATSTPVITATVTRTPRPLIPATATPPTATMPAPALAWPPNGNVFTGESAKNAALTFKWTWECPQCVLGPDDNFVVIISYLDKTGKPMSTGGGTKDNFLLMGNIVRGAGELYLKAQEDKYQWYVQVRRGEQPVSPPSQTWRFEWK